MNAIGGVVFCCFFLSTVTTQKSIGFRDNKCGLFCLSFCMHLIDPGNDRSVILSRTISNPKGITLAEIGRLAHENGFKSLALRGDPNTLVSYATLTTPAIIGEKGRDHFYVCTGRSQEGTITLIDAIEFRQLSLYDHEIDDYLGRNAIFVARSDGILAGLQVQSGSWRMFSAIAIFSGVMIVIGGIAFWLRKSVSR